MDGLQWCAVTQHAAGDGKSECRPSCHSPARGEIGKLCAQHLHNHLVVQCQVEMVLIQKLDRGRETQNKCSCDNVHHHSESMSPWMSEVTVLPEGWIRKSDFWSRRIWTFPERRCVCRAYHSNVVSCSSLWNTIQEDVTLRHTHAHTRNRKECLMCVTQFDVDVAQDASRHDLNRQHFWDRLHLDIMVSQQLLDLLWLC